MATPASEGAEAGRALVADVRSAATRHRRTWEAMVPDLHTVDLTHEPAEEAAYAEMNAAKRRLRDHICAAYGLSVDELIGLAS